MKFRKLEIVEWKDIKGYEGLYKVSNNGNVISLDKKIASGLKYNRFVMRKGRVLKNSLRKGYCVVSLSKNNIRKSYYVHRLVAEAFIDNPNNYPQINHKNGEKTDNNIKNLEWCNAQQNIKHSFDIGLHTKSGIQKSINECIKKRVRPILQFDKKNNFINEFNSITEAGNKTNINSKSIWCCLKEITKSSGGFIWKYKEVL